MRSWPDPLAIVYVFVLRQTMGYKLTSVLAYKKIVINVNQKNRVVIVINPLYTASDGSPLRRGVATVPSLLY